MLPCAAQGPQLRGAPEEDRSLSAQKDDGARMQYTVQSDAQALPGTQYTRRMTCTWRSCRDMPRSSAQCGQDIGRHCMRACSSPHFVLVASSRAQRKLCTPPHRWAASRKCRSHGMVHTRRSHSRQSPLGRQPRSVLDANAACCPTHRSSCSFAHQGHRRWRRLCGTRRNPLPWSHSRQHCSFVRTHRQP